MMVLLAGSAWAGLVLWLLVRAFRQFKVHRPLPAPSPGDPAASVTVIVPVRNEITNIGACLAALQRQSGLAADFAIVVVDDESRDGTAEAVACIAARDP